MPVGQDFVRRTHDSQSGGITTDFASFRISTDNWPTMSSHITFRIPSFPAYRSLYGQLLHLPISLTKQLSRSSHVSSPSIGHNIAQLSPWALCKGPFLRRTIVSDKPSNAHPTRAQAIWLSSALTGHIVQSVSPDLTRSNNVNTTCSTAQRRLRFARSSLEIHTHGRTNVSHIDIGRTCNHNPRIVSVVTTTATAMTTVGDRTTAVTNTAMTNIEQTTSMTGTTTTGMTGTINGIHETIEETLTEVRGTIDGITTIVVGTLLQTYRTTLFPITRHGPTRLHKRPGTTHTLSHTQSTVTPATRHRLPALSVTNRPLCYPMPNHGPRQGPGREYYYGRRSTRHYT